MRFEYAPSLEKSLRRIPVADQHRTAETIEQIVGYFASREAPQGLGLKKLFHHEQLGGVFEARISRARRLLFTVRHDAITFLRVGNHDDVQRFIRSFQ